MKLITLEAEIKVQEKRVELEREYERAKASKNWNACEKLSQQLSNPELSVCRILSIASSLVMLVKKLATPPPPPPPPPGNSDASGEGALGVPSAGEGALGVPSAGGGVQRFY
jgi:hypothetical protein